MDSHSDMPGTDLGRRISEQRHRAGLSVAEAADRAGMSAGYLQYLESAEAPNPTQACLIRLAAALNTVPSALSGAGLSYPPGRGGASQGVTLAEISAEECHRRLAAGGVGRFLFVEPGRGPVAMPVNFAMDGRDVVFRTARSGGIVSALHEQPVSFDVDHMDDALGTGWSVLLTGDAVPISDPAELDRVVTLHIEPWAGGDRPLYVRFRAREVTGRVIQLAG
jgi:nitroimidazol reductase NimA-like FMN-containing flavoprotein (pyridoxamine 5'-phosphate oxidase superfamily)